MKLHHTTALALIGWYLMAAPLAPSRNGKLRRNDAAPISQWTTVGSFDTAAQCNESLASSQNAASGAEQPSNDTFNINSVYHGEQCIASDDPRLAK